MAKPFDETGFSEEHRNDEVCNQLTRFLRPAVEAHCGTKFEFFKCARYVKQDIYGTNYKIKVATGNNFLHLHAYKPPNRPAQLNLVENNRTSADPLNEPFPLSGLARTYKMKS